MAENGNSLNQRLGINIGVEGVNKFADSLKDGYVSAKDSFKGITDSLNDEMAGAFDKMKDATTSALDSINGATGETNDILQQQRDIVTDHVNDMGDSMKSVWNTTDLKVIDKYNDAFKKKIAKVAGSYAMMEDYTGISAKEATDYVTKLTKITKSVDGEFNLYKSMLGITDKSQVAAARLEMFKYLGDDKDTFLDSYEILLKQQGITAEKAGNMMRKSFLNGGDQMSMDLKKKIIPDIIKEYQELTSELNMKFDVKGHDRFTKSVMKNTHMLMKAGRMNQDEAYETAKAFASIEAKMSDDKVRTAMLDSDRIDELVKDNQALEVILGRMGGTDKLADDIKNKGYLNTILAMKAGMNKKQKEKFLKNLPALNKMLGETMSDDVMDKMTQLFLEKTENVTNISKDYDKSQKKAEKKGHSLLKDIRARNVKYWKSQLNSAEKYSDYLEKETEYRVLQLTQKPADKFIRKRADVLKSTTMEAINLAKTGDTYVTGALVKRFSALKRMGVMGLFVDLDGGKQMSGMNAHLTEVASSIGSVALSAAPAITAMNTMGIKFGGLGMIAKPFTSSLGLMNKATLGMFGSLTKLSGIAGVGAFGLSKLRSKIGDDNIMKFLNGDLEQTGGYLQKIKEGLSYDFTRVFMKKQMVFQKEFNKMKKGDALYNDVRSGSKVISNETINQAFSKKGSDGEKARKLIFDAYGVNVPNLANAKQIEDARKQMIAMNRKRTYGIAEKEIKERANKFLDILDKNLSFMGKAMSVIWDRVKVHIFGGIDTNGDIVAPLYVKIIEGISGLMNKLKGAKLFGKGSGNVISDKMKAILGIGIGAAFMSPGLRGAFGKGMGDLVVGSKKRVGKAMKSVYEHAFAKRNKLMKVTMIFGAIGAGVQLYNALQKPGGAGNVLGMIESKLGLKPETLSIFNNFKSFFSDTLIPKLTDAASTIGTALTDGSMFLLDFFATTILPEIPGAIWKGVSVVFSKLWDNKANLALATAGITTFLLMKRVTSMAYNKMVSVVKTGMTNMGNAVKAKASSMGKTAMYGSGYSYDIKTKGIISGSKGGIRGKLGGLRDKIRGQEGSFNMSKSGRLIAGAVAGGILLDGMNNGMGKYFNADSMGTAVASGLTSLGAMVAMINPLAGAVMMAVGAIINVVSDTIKKAKDTGINEKQYKTLIGKNEKLQAVIADWHVDTMAMLVADDTIKTILSKKIREGIVKLAKDNNLSKEVIAKQTSDTYFSKDAIGMISSEADLLKLAEEKTRTQNESIRAAAKKRFDRDTTFWEKTKAAVGGTGKGALTGTAIGAVGGSAFAGVGAVPGAVAGAVGGAVGGAFYGFIDKEVSALNKMNKDIAKGSTTVEDEMRQVIKTKFLNGVKTIKQTQYVFDLALSVQKKAIANGKEFNINFLKDAQIKFNKVSEIKDFMIKNKDVIMKDFDNEKLMNEYRQVMDRTGQFTDSLSLVSSIFGADKGEAVFLSNISDMEGLVDTMSNKTGFDKKHIQTLYMNSFGNILNKQFSSYAEFSRFMSTLTDKEVTAVKEKFKKDIKSYSIDKDGDVKNKLDFIKGGKEKYVQSKLDASDNSKIRYKGRAIQLKKATGFLGLGKSADILDSKKMDAHYRSLHKSKEDIKSLYKNSENEKVFIEKTVEQLKERNKDNSKYKFSSIGAKAYAKAEYADLKAKDTYQKKWDSIYADQRNKGNLSASMLFKYEDRDKTGENERETFLLASEKTKSLANVNMGLDSMTLGNTVTMSDQERLDKAKEYALKMNEVYTGLKHSSHVADQLMAQNAIETNKNMLISAMGGAEKAKEQLKGTSLDFNKFTMSQMNDFLSKLNNKQREAFIANLERYKNSSGKLAGMLDKDLSSMTTGIGNKVKSMVTDLSGRFEYVAKLASLMGMKDQAKAGKQIAYEKHKNTLKVYYEKAFESKYGSKMTDSQRKKLDALLDKQFKDKIRGQYISDEYMSNIALKKGNVRGKMANKMFENFNLTNGQKTTHKTRVNTVKINKLNNENFGLGNALSRITNGAEDKSKKVLVGYQKKIKASSNNLKLASQRVALLRRIDINNDGNISENELKLIEAKGKDKKYLIRNKRDRNRLKKIYDLALKKQEEWVKLNGDNTNNDKGVDGVDYSAKADAMIEAQAKGQAVVSDMYTKTEIKNLVNNEEGVKSVISNFTRLSNSIESLVNLLKGSGINVKVVSTVTPSKKGPCMRIGD